MQTPQPNSPIVAQSWENILPQLVQRDPEFSKKVGAMVVTRKESDLKSSSGYRRKQKRYLQLFSGQIPGKKSNQKNILYVHLPLLTKAVLKFHGKLHTSFFPARGDIAALSIMRPDQRDRERAITRCMNMIMRNWVTEYIAAHDSGSLDALLYGSAFSIWRWDSTLERPAFEFATGDTVIVPYTYRSARPDMSDVPWFTWVLRMHRHDIEAAADKGDFDAEAVKKLYPQPYKPDGTAAPETHERMPDSVQETSDSIQGLSPDEEAPSRPREVLWHHCWLALPGETRQRPVEIFVDETTKTVLRVCLREKDDPADVQRFQADMQVYEGELASQQAVFADAMMKHQQATMDHADLVGRLSEAGVPPEGMPIPPAPPEQPAPPPEPQPARKVPVSKITHYQCLPNPEGFYGYGLGLLVDGHNVTADEVMSLYTSLMRMNLMPTGVFPRESKNPRGEFNLVLGEMQESRLPADQIDKAFKLVQFPPPDPNAFKVEQRQSEAVEEITADDILIGAQGASGQSATEADLRASNAMAPIATIAGRYNRSRENEVKVLAHLLSEMLPQDGFHFYNNDQAGQGVDPEEFVVYPEDFKEDLAVVFTTDPQLASQPQRERTAMRTFETVMKTASAAAGPIPVLDPMTAVALIRAAAAEVFKTMDRPEYARLIENAPMPQPPMPPGAPGGNPNAPNGPDSGGPGVPGMAEPAADPEAAAAPVG